MITYKINNKKYELKNNFSDWTLRDAIKVADVPMDEEAFIELLSKEDETEYPQQFLDYIIKVLSFVSTCPKDVYKKTEPNYVIVLWLRVREIVASLFFLNLENYQPVQVEKIKYKGKTYVTPENLKVDGESIFMFKEPAKNVIEASNLMVTISDLSKKGIKHLSYLTAILLKPADEKIVSDEQLVKRAELFLDLPLDVHLSIFFCLYFCLNNYTLSSRVSLEARLRAEKRRPRYIIGGFLKWLTTATGGLWSKLRALLYGKSAKF